MNRGIVSWGTYVPRRRLDRSSIAPIAGGGGGTGTRAVASYDEDTTTMGVEAARQALANRAGEEPSSLWFATTSPAYLDKTNATAVHAALRLGRSVPGYDAIGSVRSAVGAWRAALTADGDALAVTADLRSGLPGSADEAAGGDGASALVFGEDPAAEIVARQSVTAEFLDRWRAPGDLRSRVWEERFGERQYTELGVEAWEAALKQAGIGAERIDHLVVSGLHDRAVAAVARRTGVASERIADSLAATIGNTGAAHPGLLLAATLERARPGELIALVVLADGADALILRATDALSAGAPRRSVTDHASAGAGVSYGKFLAWRGVLPVEPPRRPEPARPSAAAAGRSVDWKFGFVGSQGADGSIHLPPSPTMSHRGRWPTRPERSSRSRSIGWPTRRARPWSSRWSTSMAAAACPSSSPTSTPTRSRSGRALR